MPFGERQWLVKLKGATHALWHGPTARGAERAKGMGRLSRGA